MNALATTRETEATRNAIVEASVALFLERRSNDFSVQDVADRAGLTHRTVYRYFPTREDLMASMAEQLAARIAQLPFREVSTVEEWMNLLGAHLARTEASFETHRSILAATLASDELRLFGQSLGDRDSHVWLIFRRQFRRLDRGDARRTFAVLRHLTSSTSYILLRLRFGLSPAEATEAIRSVASVVVTQAARRDRAVNEKGRRS